MQNIDTTDDFYRKVIDTRPVVGVFTAGWCGDCHFLAPNLPGLTGQFDQLDFVNLDIDHHPDIARAHKVDGVPSFILFHKGRELFRLVNTNRKTKEEVQDFLTKGLALLN